MQIALWRLWRGCSTRAVGAICLFMLPWLWRSVSLRRFEIRAFIFLTINLRVKSSILCSATIRLPFLRVVVAIGTSCVRAHITSSALLPSHDSWRVHPLEIFWLSFKTTYLQQLTPARVRLQKPKVPQRRTHFTHEFVSGSHTCTGLTARLGRLRLIQYYNNDHAGPFKSTTVH